jgi:hypothetical protein
MMKEKIRELARLIVHEQRAKGMGWGAEGAQERVADQLTALVDDATRGLNAELEDAQHEEDELGYQRDLTKSACGDAPLRFQIERAEKAETELAHWKTCTGYATPEDQYMAWMDAGEKQRARIAALEAALANALEELGRNTVQCELELSVPTPTDREPAHVTRAREYGWTEIVRAPLESMELWLGLPPEAEITLPGADPERMAQWRRASVIQERARAAAIAISVESYAHGLVCPDGKWMARVIAEEMEKLGEAP